MMLLYGGSSPNVKKVSIMLEELEQPHEYRAINCMRGENYTDEFGRLNPVRKIPVLVDPDGPDGKPCTVFESGAILIYLAEKSGRFLAHDGAARYAALQWLMVQMSGIGPLFGQFTHFRRFAPPGNDYALARYETAARRMLESLDAQLAANQYVAGDSYSIADMAIYPWTRNRPKVWGGDWSRYANVWRWFDEVDRRPAVVRMNEAYKAIEAREQEEGLKASADEIDRFLGRGRFSQSPVMPRPATRAATSTRSSRRATSAGGEAARSAG
jgi:GST-like protein